VSLALDRDRSYIGVN